MPSKNNPDTSGYFHVNCILSLIALSITQSAHHGYSSVNDINDIYTRYRTTKYGEPPSGTRQNMATKKNSSMFETVPFL